MKKGVISLAVFFVLFILASCGKREDTAFIGNSRMDETENITNEVTPTVPSADNEQDSLPINKGIIAEQLLDGKDGVIHYSYYLPENYSADRLYPMMVVMPGYDMMWFGEESSGTNLNWHGFLSWRELEEDMIVVSAQLTDWGEKSARQAIELTEFFLDNFPVDCNRVYAAGYSAGGETMSQAVSMRPDLYAAYLHSASRWDGAFKPVAENGVAVYIFMAENDEYYGSQKARDAYQGLYEAYQSIGWTQAQIDEVLQVEIPDNEYFNSRGIYNYHGGGNILFEDQSILQWIVEKKNDGGEQHETKNHFKNSS